MTHKWFLSSAALIAGASIFPGFAAATTITGGVDISGDITLGTATAPSISFEPDVAGQTYTFTVDSGSGSFVSLSGGGDENDPLSPANAAINTVVDIPDFISFINTSTTFTLTEIYGGIDGDGGCSDNTGAAAAGNICSPTGTPFNLQDQSSTNSTASFDGVGYFVNGGVDTPASISFSAASTGASFEQILCDEEGVGVCANAKSTPVITYGAQITALAATPEPSTLMLTIGAALLLAGNMFRRKKTS